MTYDPADRRAALNSGMDEILADYNEAELELLAGFLQKVTAAGEASTKFELARLPAW